MNSGSDADRFQSSESSIIRCGNGFQNFCGEFFRGCGDCGKRNTIVHTGIGCVQRNNSHLFGEDDSEIHERVAEKRNPFVRDIKERIVIFGLYDALPSGDHALKNLFFADSDVEGKLEDVFFTPRASKRSALFEESFRPLFTVHTVDGFQGQERDVIILSLVRANAEGQIGFLRDLRRMNVAMTRARMKLIILGDADTLTRHPFYKALYEYVAEKGKLT